LVGAGETEGDIAPPGAGETDGDSAGVVGAVSEEPQALKGNNATPRNKTVSSLPFINAHQNDIENRFSSDHRASVNLFIEITYPVCLKFAL
jgi:hypothetical protein